MLVFAGWMAATLVCTTAPSVVLLETPVGDTEARDVVLEAIRSQVEELDFAVVSSSPDNVPADLAAQTQLARSLAQRHQARAVVWMRDEPQLQVVVFEAPSDTLVVRDLSDALGALQAKALGAAVIVRGILHSAPPLKPEPAAVIVPSPAPLPPAPLPPWELGLRYRPTVVSPSKLAVVQFGEISFVGFFTRHLGMRASLLMAPNLRVRRSLGTLSLAHVGGAVGGVWSLVYTDTWQLQALAQIGLQRIGWEVSGLPADLSQKPGTVDYSPFMAVAGEVGYSFTRRIKAVLALGADLSVQERLYVVGGSSSDTRLLAERRFQPWGSLGAALTFE